MTKASPTRITDLKPGHIVRAHGGRFRVTTAPHDSICHGPKDPATGWAMGPAGVAVAYAECIEGTRAGYFRPGSGWTFQGATWVTVCVEA